MSPCTELHNRSRNMRSPVEGIIVSFTCVSEHSAELAALWWERYHELATVAYACWEKAILTMYSTVMRPWIYHTVPAYLLFSAATYPTGSFIIGTCQQKIWAETYHIFRLRQQYAQVSGTRAPVIRTAPFVQLSEEESSCHLQECRRTRCGCGYL